MRYTFADYKQAADLVAQRLERFRPEVAMILGSGLGDMADLAENPIVIPYGEIPGFSVSTAPVSAYSRACADCRNACYYSAVFLGKNGADKTAECNLS